MNSWLDALIRGPRGRAGGDDPAIVEPFSAWYVAVLDSASPRFSGWVGVFGGNSAPVYDDAPLEMSDPGGPTHPVYRLALHTLDLATLERLAQFLASLFDESVESARRSVETEGVIIPASDVARTLRADGPPA